jgi:hypothetical protein
MNNFAIQCINDNSLFWSNDEGWTDSDNFEVFTLEESESIDLPIEGQFVRIFTI